VGYDRLEQIRLDKPGHEIYRPTRDPEVLDDALVFEAQQHLHRAARRHHVLEGFAPGFFQVLGVVQIHELEAIQPQETQAALDRAAYLLAGEVAGLEITVGLRSQHAVLWQASDLLEHLAYATLALPVAVGSGSVEEVQWALEDGV
jgi:hypothetical protein